MPAPGVPPCCAEAAVTPASNARAAAAVSNFFMKELLPSHFAEHCNEQCPNNQPVPIAACSLPMPGSGSQGAGTFMTFLHLSFAKDRPTWPLRCCNGTVYCGNKTSHHSRKAVAGCRRFPDRLAGTASTDENSVGLSPHRPA